MRRKIAAVFAVAGLVVGLAAPVASAVPPQHKCNAGAGNASEDTVLHDCDPGNSGGNNNAGD